MCMVVVECFSMDVGVLVVRVVVVVWGDVRFFRNNKFYFLQSQNLRS